MSPIKLKVSTPQHKYFAGNVVQGSVEVQVCTKNNKESSADELKLQLVGHVKTAVEYRPAKEKKQRWPAKTRRFCPSMCSLDRSVGRQPVGSTTFPSRSPSLRACRPR
ncbi:unnamed protein product [Ectocarpus sp. 13 AM-2016]